MSSDYQFDNIAALQRDRAIEGETGTELGLDGGITLIVLAATDANPRWKAQSEAMTREIRRLSNAKASGDRSRKYLARKYAETLIKDWRGVTSGGVEIPFSVDACAAFLVAADDAFTALEGIVYETKNFRGQRIEVLVDDAKKS